MVRGRNTGFKLQKTEEHGGLAPKMPDLGRPIIRPSRGAQKNITPPGGIAELLRQASLHIKIHPQQILHGINRF